MSSARKIPENAQILLPETASPAGYIALENRLYEFLCRKYVQRADDRQKRLGLQYTTAETHDLAEEVVKFIRTHL